MYRWLSDDFRLVAGQLRLFSFCAVSKCRGTSVGKQDKLMRWRCVSDSQLLCHCDSMPVSQKVYGSFMISDISGLRWNSLVTDEGMLKRWQQSLDHTVSIVKGFVKISNWSTQNGSINQVKVNILTLQVLNFVAFFCEKYLFKNNTFVDIYTG